MKQRRKRILPLALVALALTQTLAPQAQAGTSLPTGNMIANRAFQTATTLSDGTVLVAGGASGANALNSAEIYHPDTGSWTPTFAMATARTQHTATLLPNGKVLVVGGMINPNNFKATPNAELYDPATGKWTPTAPLQTARFGQTATLLTNGMVLVAGGLDSFGSNDLASAELYDPATGTWATTASMSASRVGANRYGIQTSPDLSAWTSLGGIGLTTNNAESFTDPRAALFPQGFYRTVQR